jgi:hypothetical protein
MYNSGNSSKNVTGASIVDGTVETVDIADDAVTADKLSNSVNTDIGTGVSASTTAGDALPKAGGTMTGTIAGFTSTGIDDNATSTAITIDASENVNIVSKMSVAAFGNTARAAEFNGGSVLFDGAGPVDLIVGDGAVAYMSLQTTNDATAMKIRNFSGAVDLVTVTRATGNTTIETGNLVIGTSGKGIDFSATSDGSGTMTSEVLDDYEEGTFTPTLLGSGSNPTVTYSSQSGSYTKIGNLVTINIYLSTSAYSGGSGNIRIGGLPFAASATAPESTGSIMGFRVNTGAEATPSINAGESFAQILSRSVRDTSTGWGNSAVSIWTATNPTIAKIFITYET